MMKTIQRTSVSMTRIVMTFVGLLLITMAYGQNQPTFDPGQDPKPPGKRWEKIQNMSDEFSGNSLNMTKWDNQDPQWKGRAPALFSVNAVSVGGGNLKIVADDNLTQQEQNQNPGYTYQGGLVRSINKATYGYYETRMKANKTCLSSTFWLFNKRNEFNGCDERTTELDITENVGINVFPNDPGRSWVDQNIVSINSNTHSRGVVGNPGCGIPVGSNGNKSPIGEPAYANYHVYGVWWKNANELIFFLDGRQVYNITPPADFDLGMYLRMVVESYDWNQPRPGFDNMNLPQAERTTYYDWTRSWRLVDDNGGGGSPQVNCNSLPSSVATSNSIQVSVDYTSDQNRDVVIELWDTSTSPDSYLGHNSTTVGAGSGTANITINLGAAPAVGNAYQLKSSIRPVGTDWTQNLDACQKNNVSLTGGGGGSCSLPWSSPNQSISNQTVNWTSPAIDISCAASVNISMDIEGLTPQVMESADYLNIYYSVDGGNQIAISENTDGFGLKTVSANNISGNSLVLTINGKTSWNDETYNVRNISVSGGGAFAVEAAVAQRQYFDLAEDFLLANFDLRPDEDDVHAAAALASMLKHPDLAGVDYHAVAGAYGEQGNTYITAATPGLYNTLFGAKNVFWSDRHNESVATENRIRDKIVSVLNSGNQVFIQEAGQSDFTYDVLQKVINESNGVNANMVRNNVIVVQHSDWNEDKTTDFKLNWVKANTDYEKIADGNSGGNGTPQYKNNSSSWLNNAKSGGNPNANAKTFWTEADAVCDNFVSGWENPTISGGGVDYSDCVEIWWIFNLGNTADNITKFWDRYVTNTPDGGGNTPTVNCNSLPSSLPTSNSIQVSVDYTSDQNRDVVVELWDTSTSPDSYLGHNSTTVGAGSGTANITINLGAAPAVGNAYQLKSSIRPVGTDWTQNLDACQKNNVSLTGGGGGSCSLPWSSPNQSISNQTVNWTSPAIDISCAASVNISMDIEGLTPQAMESADYLNIYYSVDGGNQIAISENTDGFGLKTVSANNISGNSLVLIINGKTSWNDETYNVRNISVSAVGNRGVASDDGDTRDPLSPTLHDDAGVFPNPIRLGEYFQISLGTSLGEKQIMIYDLTGRGIYQHRTAGAELRLNSSEVFKTRGLYLVKLRKQRGKDEVFKLVVK